MTEHVRSEGYSATRAELANDLVHMIFGQRPVRDGRRRRGRSDRMMCAIRPHNSRHRNFNSRIRFVPRNRSQLERRGNPFPSDPQL